MKANSIGIIGMGWVGASVAISILQKGLCRHLLINDVKKEIAEGEAMDLNHGSSFFPTCEVNACEIEEMLDCRAIVITAGRGGKPGESRLDLLNDNVNIARHISGKLKGFKGLLIIVANPVDVLTYYYQKFTGLPSGRVIGTGTMLDTARLRDIIGRKVHVDPNSIHASVIGEHGDSEVIIWSNARVGGLTLERLNGWDKKNEETIYHEVRTAAYEIIQRKGATNHAIGLVTATLLKWLLRGERRITNISSTLNGEYGLKEVALSVPTLICEEGVEKIVEVDMSSEEKEQFNNSAQILKAAIQDINKSLKV